MAGRHRGFRRWASVAPESRIRKSARTLAQRIVEHEAKLEAVELGDDKRGTVHLERELMTFREQLAIVVEELQRRGR